VDPGLNPDTQKIEEPKPRKTEVSDTFKVPQHSQYHPNLALLVLEGPLKGQKISIDKQLFRIGAELDNDLVLIDDDYISGNHAQLRYDNGELLLSDQHSLNGTLLNSVLVKDDGASKVVPGDVIQIGKSSLKLIET
jgi:pSer/pThr/pTyr-binding forkhead associated (FHA) protein